MKFNIDTPDHTLSERLLSKIDQKTKPLGALGMLEELAHQIGLIQQTLTPKLTQPTILVFAGDHGIANAGVSAYPQAVTAQMVQNFLQGGAAINVFTQQNNMQFRLIDSGVNYTFPDHPDLIDAKIAFGTQSFLDAKAMTLLECVQAMQRGADIVDNEVRKHCNIFGFGEMGISNTSSASALMSVLCDLPISECVGRGTGLDDQGLSLKLAILAQAIEFHALKNDDATLALATFGGFEIAMMVGAMLQAANHQCILLIDGFITTAALLIASRIEPNILSYCVFSHCSDEAGHKKMLAYLNAKPLLNLNLRLGEGTGAALAYPLLLAAVNFLNNMASFESAHISEKIG
jgi:nicotinate-nucleotide--dimethylbenzimidazole phosphoribosyltransferase